MLFFGNMRIDIAFFWSILILLISVTITLIINISMKHYLKKNKEHVSEKIEKRLITSFVVTLFISAFMFGNILIDTNTLTVALSHGMTRNKDTNKYEITMSDMNAFNKQSMKETKVKDMESLKNQIIIFVRYECIDCLILHDEIKELDDVIFLSSRSVTGKKAIETYNIKLTEVPQGVYVHENGESTVISFVTGTGKNIKISDERMQVLYNLKQ